MQPWPSTPLPMWDAVELVAKTRKFLSTPLGAQRFSDAVDRGLCRTLIDEDGKCDELDNEEVAACLAGVMAGRLYWISSPLLTLIEHAARTMPDEILHRTDLPVTTGIALFEQPQASCDEKGEPIPIIGWAWNGMVWRDNQIGIALGEGEARRVFKGLAWGEPEGVVSQPLTDRDGEGCISMVLPVATDTMAFGRSMSPGVAAGPDDFWRRYALRAFWILSQQRLVTVETAAPPRAVRRRLQRELCEIPDIRVVRLRRVDHRKGDPETNEVDWSHRWIVQGHWRNQWLPSRHLHRLQWINAYVKGPENRPLRVRETVNALVR